MKFSYYYLPNSLVEKKMLPSDFAVAAFLYSMAQAYGNKTCNGIYVKVKQTTIAEACGISVESVARQLKGSLHQALSYPESAASKLTDILAHIHTLLQR